MKSDDNVGMGWGGGGRRGGGESNPSPLTIIIVVNIAVFVLQYLWGGGGGVVGEGAGAVFRPWGETSRNLVFGQGRVWTLATYMFVHGGLMHILLNLVLIYTCGRALLTLVGARHFLRVYFVAGLLGGLLQIVLLPNPLVGASAGAFGLLIALATMLPQQQVTVLLFFVLPVRARLKNIAFGLVGVSVLFFLIDMVTGGRGGIPMVSGVGHAAHLGGALGGFLYIRLLGLGGVTLTREGLMRQRAKAERKHGVARRPGKVRRGRTVTASEVKRAARARGEGADFVSAEIDPILDKINSEGFGSLSDEERAILDAGSQKISDSANSK